MIWLELLWGRGPKLLPALASRAACVLLVTLGSGSLWPHPHTLSPWPSRAWAPTGLRCTEASPGPTPAAGPLGAGLLDPKPHWNLPCLEQASRSLPRPTGRQTASPECRPSLPESPCLPGPLGSVWPGRLALRKAPQKQVDRVRLPPPGHMGPWCPLPKAVPRAAQLHCAHFPTPLLPA